ESFSLRDVKLDPDRLFENLADFRKTNVSLRELSGSFFVPKEWFLLERTLLLLMGLCTALAPELNPMHVIRPYLERFVLGNDQDWTAFAVATTKDLALSAVALPGEARRFLRAAERGTLEVRFQNVDEAWRLVYAVGRQAIWVLVGIAAATFGIIWEGRGQLAAAHVSYWVAGGAGAMFLLSTFTTRAYLKRRRKR